MAAFEQSLTTLNTRLRQLTTINEKKDNEISELNKKLESLQIIAAQGESLLEGSDDSEAKSSDIPKQVNYNEKCSEDERNLIKVVEDLKRQLIEKDRLLTDTRLEALSAAHQLEQLESKLNGEHSLLVNEDELDEGVMVVNHSPSESDATTDSAHFSEINSQLTANKSSQQNSRDASQAPSINKGEDA